MQSLDRFLGLFGWVPLPVWIALAALAAGAALKFFGWRGALAAVVGVISLAGASKIRQGGWEAREKAGAENVKRVVEKAREARQNVRDEHAADPGRLHDDDGYRRD